MTILIEKAKSNRSRCGVCKKIIDVGDERVGTQRKYPFKRFICIKWHHRSCFKRHWALYDGENVESSELSKAYEKFSKAGRLVISTSVRDFRKNELNKNNLCPVTGNFLDASNAHVHHFGPMDFSRIVKTFICKYRVAVHRISYTAAQFSNDDLANLFESFHEEKKRYLLVHQDANLSILKKKKHFGPCDMCRKFRRLTWIFKEGVCETCRLSPHHKKNYMSSRQCRQEFGLDVNELSGIECQLMKNPISANFARMRLYPRERIERITLKKFGSLQRACEIQQQAKLKQRRKIRSRNYEDARTFHMNLRRDRSVTIAQPHEEEFATKSQLRYLLVLGAKSAAGLSKKAASEAIENALKSRKSK